jgi:hypothetical protein
MKQYLLGIWGVLFAGMAWMAVVSPAGAVTATGNVNIEWHQLPVIHFSLTPNYTSGYGSVIATFGTQPAPTHGPGATAVGQGSVDFGTTSAGDTYLYKYAAALTVTTNDANGFDVYGEAATVFTNSATGQAAPGGGTQVLYYLTSSASGDSNTGYTPGYPFMLTGGLVTGGTSTSSPPTITYASYPNPVAQASTPNGNFYYDYELKVPSGITTADTYFIWIVYTVVGQ